MIKGAEEKMNVAGPNQPTNRSANGTPNQSLTQTQHVLITGAKGMMGAKVASYFHNMGHVVVSLESRVEDFESVFDEVRNLKDLTTVIHLAALSDVPRCEQDPKSAYEVNLLGTAILLEAMQKAGHSPHLVFASSATVYATLTNQTAEIPITEESPIGPSSVHARTKLAAESVIREFCSSGRISATILRIFNHTHKNQSDRFLLGNVFRQIMATREGQVCQLSLGNVDLFRDIGTIGDLTRAFYQVSCNPPTRDSRLNSKDTRMQVLNLCTGHPKNLRVCIELLAKALNRRVEIAVDPKKVRDGEPLKVFGSHQKLTELTGWLPTCRTEKDLIAGFLED